MGLGFGYPTCRTIGFQQIWMRDRPIYRRFLYLTAWLISRRWTDAVFSQQVSNRSIHEKALNGSYFLRRSLTDRLYKYILSARIPCIYRGNQNQDLIAPK